MDAFPKWWQVCNCWKCKQIPCNNTLGQFLAPGQIFCLLMCASLFLSSSFGHFYPPNIPPLLNDFISYHHLLTQHHLDFLQLKYFENLSNPQHFAVFICPWFAVLTNFLKLFCYQFSTILETFPCIFWRETHLSWCGMTRVTWEVLPWAAHPRLTSGQQTTWSTKNFALLWAGFLGYFCQNMFHVFRIQWTPNLVLTECFVLFCAF